MVASQHVRAGRVGVWGWVAGRVASLGGWVAGRVAGWAGGWLGGSLTENVTSKPFPGRWVTLTSMVRGNVTRLGAEAFGVTFSAGGRPPRGATRAPTPPPPASRTPPRARGSNAAGRT